jgi:hypothetical protein
MISREGLIPESITAVLEQQGLHGGEVVAWWKIPTEYHKGVTLKPILPLLVCPCFWPHAVVLSPCLCAYCFCSMKTLPTVSTILTKTHIVSTMMPTGPCAICGNGGLDSKMINVNTIQGVSVDNVGTCCADLQAPSASVTLSTMHSTGGENPGMTNDEIQIYGSEPDKIAYLMRNRAKFGVGVVEPALAAPYAAQIVRAEPPAPPAGDPMQQLTQLTAMKDAGLITEEEYAKKKNDILSSM